MPADLEKKYIGCIIGSALGDAIGELAFRFPQRDSLAAEVNETDILRYTDDTAMAIGVAQSLIAKGDLDPEHLGKTFRDNYRAEPWRGYASGPPTIFSLVETTGISYRDAAKTLFSGGGSFGNGAAMRVAPVGLFFHNSPELAVKAFASAEPTHSHILAKHGAAIQAIAVSQAVGLGPGQPFAAQEFLTGLTGFGPVEQLMQKIESIGCLLNSHVRSASAARTLGRSVAVHESLPFALYAFLSNHGSFVESLYCAVLNGGDRDTLGAMTGAIAGAYHGIDAIPEEWQARIENRDFLESLALSLLEKEKERERTRSPSWS